MQRPAEALAQMHRFVLAEYEAAFDHQDRRTLDYEDGKQCTA